MHTSATTEPVRMIDAAPVHARFTPTGSLARLDIHGLSTLLYPAGDLEDGAAGLWCRIRVGGAVGTLWPLIGHGSAATISFSAGGPTATSTRDGVQALVRFVAVPELPGWAWHVELTSTDDAEHTVDLLYAHDLALAPFGAVRTNEYYVSQYLDLTPVATGNGVALGVRQNMPGQRQPWALVGGLTEVDGWATDLLQLTGRGRLDGEPLPGLAEELPAARLQHEHTLAVLSTRPLTVAPGTTVRSGFYGLVVADHPDATSDADAAHADRALAHPELSVTAAPGSSAPAAARAGGDQAQQTVVTPSLFAAAAMFGDRNTGDGDIGDRNSGDGGIGDRAIAARAIGDRAIGDRSVDPPADAVLVESDAQGPLAWFQASGGHVVTRRKQRQVLRPHGHLVRTGGSLVPDERALTATCWMAGGFVTHLTQGHVALGSALSLRRGYLGLLQAAGLRIFVAGDTPDDPWRLLGVPDTWTVWPDRCRWDYHDGGRSIAVEVAAGQHAHQITLTLTDSRPTGLLVAAHVSLDGDDDTGPTPARHVRQDGMTITGTDGRRLELTWPAGSVVGVAGDGPLRGGPRSDGRWPADGPTSWVTVQVGPADAWQLVLSPDLLGDNAGEPAGEQPEPMTAGSASLWNDISSALGLSADDELVTAIDATLGWYAHDALIHYLSPRGLEQYTGGGWGTRDVSQGPVGLLTALGRPEALRTVAVLLLRAQNERGDWPQAFDFYPRYRREEQSDAHGDVIYWPLLAIGDYLAATGDSSLLDERIAFVGDGRPGAADTALAHLRRALDVIDASLIPGTGLPAYGHGDWNDSLQPADPTLAARMCSSWTVTLQAQALGTLSAALHALGRADATELASRADAIVERGNSAMRELLIADGVLAGYGVFDDVDQDAADGAPGGSQAATPAPRLLVHPTDTVTGLRYSVLPMIHAIAADLLDPQSARRHLDLIAEHLTGPDGARLFDRPVRYSGGPMHIFQRAEASTFFGREIGIMYTHAHLRYAQALARFGDAPGFLRALALASPIGIGDRVPSARPRQSTTYYSSSDAAFADRYAAADRYQGVLDGTVPLEGGWRVYSSGPGIYLRLVVEDLLGIRRRADVIEIDPVVDPALGKLTARFPLQGIGSGATTEIRYRTGQRGCGVRSVSADGVVLPTTALQNPYRRAGVRVRTADIIGARTIEVELA